MKLEKMKYEFENINIGDEVIFESTRMQSNHDLFWEVIDKEEKAKNLIIKLDNMGYSDERWTLNINDVTQHLVVHKNNN